MEKARFPLGRSLGRALLHSFIVGGALWVPSVQAGSPRLSSVYPSIAQRGTEQEVVLSGGLLSDARTLLFDEPGFEASVVKAEATKVTAKIKVPADARLGEHRLRVITESGVSDLRFFYVSPFPVVEESNPKDSIGASIKAAQRTAARAAAKAAHAAAVAKAAEAGQPPPPPPAPEALPPEGPQLVPVNTTVYGRVPGEDLDQWAVELAAGQRLSIEVGGFQFQSTIPFDPEVIVQKPDGKTLKVVGGTVFGRGNPVFSTQVPEAGLYTISIRDVTQSASGGACQYFMHVGDFPRPVGVLPAGAPAGQRDGFTALGAALGEGKASGSIVSWGGGFGGLLLEGLGGIVPTAVPVRVSDLPNVSEGPQVERPADTQNAVALPAAFNGVISNRGEVDYFRFSAKKSQAFQVGVYARSLRSQLDSVLEIYNAAGAKLTSNDDAGGPDSSVRWVAPADGEYVVAVKDQQGRGGETFHYRVEFEPVSPRVKTYLPEIVANSSQERRAVVVPQGNRFATMVRVKREDFAGALKLQAQNLPAGVSVSGGFVSKGGDTALMVFEAEADAPRDQRLFNLLGETVAETEPVTPAAAPGQETAAAKPVETSKVDVQVEHFISTGEIGNGVALYRIRESLLPIAVTAPVPVGITVAQPTQPAMRGAVYPLKIKVDRREDFKGAVDVSLVYAAPGVSTVGPVKVPEDATEVELPLSIAPTAPLGKISLCTQAGFDPGSGRIWTGSNLFDLEISEAPLTGTLVRSSISQGGSAEMKMKLTGKTDFPGKIRIELLGLPSGVTAEPREVDAEATEVIFPLKAADNAAVGLQKQVIAQFTVSRGGVNLVATCASGGILRVDRGTQSKTSSTEASPPISVAKNTPAPAPAVSPTAPGSAEKSKTQPIGK